MPEGDTIHRTAATLDRWLAGREVTAARVAGPRLPAGRLVGRRVVRVEARGKHLLVRFDDGLVLYTHLRMTGSWHVYGAGERWRKAASRARLVLEAGDRVAVCFDAPVVELLVPGAELVHPALSRLGPDVLMPPIDTAEVARRAAAFATPTTTVGEALLDQRVVSGIGNIWRCELLFVEGVNPFAPLADLDSGTLGAAVEAAACLMQRSVGGRRPSSWVYGRARRPCRRCKTPVEAAPDARGRTVYWCPRCQLATAGSVSTGGS